MAKKFCGCDMFFDSGRSEPARCEFCGGVKKNEILAKARDNLGNKPIHNTFEFLEEVARLSDEAAARDDRKKQP